jgi:hypothetical protein
LRRRTPRSGRVLGLDKFVLSCKLCGSSLVAVAYWFHCVPTNLLA